MSPFLSQSHHSDWDFDDDASFEDILIPNFKQFKDFIDTDYTL